MRKIATYLMLLAALAGCRSGIQNQSPEEEGEAIISQEQVADKPESSDNSFVGKTMRSYPIITRYGKKTKLNTLCTAPRNLFVFYFPSNESYRQTFDEMFMNSQLQSLLIDKAISINVVDLESDLEEIRYKALYFPPTWVVACEDGEDIDAGELPLPYNPTIFLLDREGKVMAICSNANEIMPIITSENQ